MNFKQEIDKLIESNLKNYQDDSDNFLREYNLEKEFTKEYEGRQILELLQNADDEGSKEVLIEWEKKSATLRISNKGKAFKVSGVKSLMRAGLSSKTKAIYIGNKGLGFRSILNWGEQINVYTNDCKISFSESFAKDVFENQLNLSDSDKEKLRTERNLSFSAVPFPTLSVPKIINFTAKSEWTTTIEIFCIPEVETDIENQLSEIREEILLFLNNIEKISIRIDGEEDIILESIKTEEENYEVISIKDKIWKVFTKEDVLPNEFQDKSKNEQQSYNLKVAFQDDLSDNYKKLFNFFPTQLSISLPCIIHGTFELSSSRNHLNPSNKNRFILRELVQLLKECSLFLTQQNIDWRPYKILTPTSKSSDSKLIEEFYNELEEIKKTEIIYPCISNQYHPLDEAVYYNDEFDAFFMTHFPETLPGLLIPLNQEVENKFQNDIYNHEYLIDKIDELSLTEIKLPIRAELITHLSKVIPFKEEQVRFSLLVNESGKVISKDDLTFTPVVRSEEEFKIPKSVKVDFIKSELYDLLISIFENTFDKKEPKSRELQRSIKSIVNIQPYDSNNVIDKIITGSKDALKTLSAPEDKIICIKEMVASLFANFKNIENRQEKLKINLPLITKSNSISDAENLFLSSSYPSGALTEIIYEDLFKKEDYLIEVDFWNLENEDLDTIESFFLWLGVNKFSKIITINLQNNWSEKNYIDYIFDNGTEKPDNFEIGRIQKDSFVSKIDRFNVIKSLSVNKLLLLVLKDSTIRKQLEGNEERISWYYVTWRPIIISSYSYLRFQFLQTNLFSKYILEEGGEELNKLINEDFQIDYEFLEQHGINRTEVKSILIKLGAKESFNDISPKNIYEILKSIPDKDDSKKGKSTQTIYKLALESLVKQESTYPVPDDILYFARKVGNEEYLPLNEIYYTDNSILPKKILNTLPIINLPKRIGEDNVEKYFGVKSLREFKILINEQTLQYNLCDADLNRLFDSIKPYILAYRLESPNLKKRITDNVTKRKEAKKLKDCKIHIVTECFFKFGENEEIPIDEKEFINVKDTFYFKESSLYTVDTLKKDSWFCDAFAEMMCIIFKVNDLKNDFRQILKNDLQDTIHLAKQDLDREKVEEAFLLLGVSRVEIDFWKNVFKLNNKILIEPIDNIAILKQQVKENLAITITEEYEKVDFDNFSNKESYEFILLLCNSLNLSIKQILPNGIYNWHRKEFISSIKDLEFIFKQNVWKFLNNIKIDQKKFITILSKYNLSFITLIDKEIQGSKFDLEVDYNLKTKELIKKHFNIELNSSISKDIFIKNFYEDLLIKYNIEEVDISDESVRSLLFFNGNLEVIETNLIKLFGSNSEEKKDSDSEDLNIIGSLIDASLSKKTKILPVRSGNNNGPWVHSGKGELMKKRKGKKAELLVYNTLVNTFGIKNVKWVSGNSTTPDKSDNLHYDIEYKNADGVWKYLEVKAMSDNQFIISNPEKEKGMAEPENFELALVEETSIYMVKDAFKFNLEESFESNSKFVAYAKDFVISFNVNTLKK